MELRLDRDLDQKRADLPLKNGSQVNQFVVAAAAPLNAANDTALVTPPGVVLSFLRSDASRRVAQSQFRKYAFCRV